MVICAITALLDRPYPRAKAESPACQAGLAEASPEALRPAEALAELLAPVPAAAAVAGPVAASGDACSRASQHHASNRGSSGGTPPYDRGDGSQGLDRVPRGRCTTGPWAQCRLSRDGRLSTPARGRAASSCRGECPASWGQPRAL